MKIKNLFNPFKYYEYLKKRRILKNLNIIGTNLIFDPFSSIMTPQFLRIGDNVFIGEKAYISAKLTIGNNVMFGPRPVIIGGNHYFGVMGKSVRFLHPQNDENYEEIIIEDEVWFGANVLLLGGITIGFGSVIGAGSILTKSIPPFVMAVGNPCKPIRLIFSDDRLKIHIEKLGKSPNFANEIIDRRKQELLKIKMANLLVVDNSANYWELK